MSKSCKLCMHQQNLALWAIDLGDSEACLRMHAQICNEIVNHNLMAAAVLCIGSLLRLSFDSLKLAAQQ